MDLQGFEQELSVFLQQEGSEPFSEPFVVEKPVPTTVYLLLDPRPGHTQIRYVGKTQKSLKVRLARHIWDAKETRDGVWVDRTHRANWIRNILRDGSVPVIKPMEVFQTNEKACAWERFLIYHMRPYACLVNSTDGGDGGIISRKPSCPDEVVIEAYRSGKSSRQIAKEFKTCAKRVMAVAKKAGIARLPNRKANP